MTDFVLDLYNTKIAKYCKWHNSKIIKLTEMTKYSKYDLADNAESFHRVFKNKKNPQKCKQCKILDNFVFISFHLFHNVQYLYHVL